MAASIAVGEVDSPGDGLAVSNDVVTNRLGGGEIVGFHDLSYVMSYEGHVIVQARENISRVNPCLLGRRTGANIEDAGAHPPTWVELVLPDRRQAWRDAELIPDIGIIRFIGPDREVNILLLSLARDLDGESFSRTYRESSIEIESHADGLTRDGKQLVSLMYPRLSGRAIRINLSNAKDATRWSRHGPTFWMGFSSTSKPDNEAFPERDIILVMILSNTLGRNGKSDALGIRANGDVDSE